MKFLICCFLIITAIFLQAQKPIDDSTEVFTIKELNLTPEQKLVIKKLVWEYKLEDRKRKRESRHRMFLILNANQQMTVRRWWRNQIRNSVKLH